MEQKFEVFFPNQYTEKDKAALDGLMATIERDGGVGPSVNRTEKMVDREMKQYAWLWNPYDPLYNDPDYAAGTRWGAMPAMPCFAFKENITGFPMMDDVGDDLGNIFYYANDGGDVSCSWLLYTSLLQAARPGSERPQPLNLRKRAPIFPS